MGKLQYCEILRTRINVTNMQETLDYIHMHIEALRGKYICVSNVHTTVMAYENKKYRAIQNGAAMALPDGAPLSIYSRRKGFVQAQRVTGPDLMLELFRVSPQYGYRHYFYGATQETLADMRKALERDFPKITIAGMYSPPFRRLTDEEEQQAVWQINKAQPDFIWVGLGAPKQEEWMAAHKDKVSGVMFGVGAGFDYLAGHIQRAPKWMQRMSLEWLYRLLQDPKRLWNRYITTNIKFFWYIFREHRRNLRKRHRKK